LTLVLALVTAQRNGDLFFFSSIGDLPKVTSLLASGVDPNKAFSSGLTSLHAAASNNKVDVASELLKKGAKLNATDSKGATPLHLAVLSNSPNAVSWLLKQGAPSNVPDRNGVTPIQAAITGNNKAILDIFKQFNLTGRK
jgi:ankyrin